MHRAAVSSMLAVVAAAASMASIACRDREPPRERAQPVIVPVPVAVPIAAAPTAAAPTDDAVAPGSASAAASDAGTAPAAPAAPAPTAASAAAPPAAVPRPVWSLGPNRLLAHRLVAGDLVIDAAGAGFARYTRFDMPVARWTLRRTVDGEGAAAADRRASLDVPLTRDQVAATRFLVLRVHLSRGRELSIKLNGRSFGHHPRVARGWQTLALAIPARRLRPGENQIVLESGHDHLALAWLRLAADRGTDDPRPAAIYDAAADRFHLTEGAGLAWYVQLPAGAHLVGAAPGCHVQVAARSGDGTLVGGMLGGDTGNVDLARLGGRVVRLELTARDCPLVLLSGAHIEAPAPPLEPLATAAPPRYVILWVMDALRADRVRPFQPGARPTVPNFEKLAATGVVFRQYYEQGNESQTSHASVWTSTYPAIHNVRLAGVGGNWRIPRSLAVIGELLSKAGLATLGVTGNGFVTVDGGYTRGFDEFRNMMREKGVINGVLPGEEVLRDALRRLDAHRKEPAFLFLGTVDTHGPWIARKPWIERYDPGPYDGPHQTFASAAALGMVKGVMGCSRVPEPRDLQRLNAIYDSAVSYHDARLGDLVAALRRWGIYDQTMIIITADHGEEWFEDGRCGHGGSLREPLVRVPLLIHYPAAFPPAVVDEGAEGIDVLPTVLDALGAPVPAQAQGQSLRPLAHGLGRGWARPSYASQYEYAHAMRLGRWKIQVGRAGVPVVRDVIADPLERDDLSATRPFERRYLTDALGFFLHWRRAWKKRAWGVVSNLEPAGALELGRSGW